jgi:ATP-binding cassette, subfamily B, bacterial
MFGGKVQMESYKQKNKNGFNKLIWLKLYKYLKLYKKQVIAVTAAVIVMSMAEVYFAIIFKNIIDGFLYTDGESNLRSFMVIFFILITINASATYIFMYGGGVIQSGIIYSMKKDAFEKIQKLSISYFDINPVGKTLNTVTADIHTVSEIISWQFVELIGHITTLIIIVITMLYLNLQLAAVVIFFMPISVLIIILLQKKILKNERKVRSVNAKIAEYTNEGINGVLTSKSLVTQEENQEEFIQITQNMKSVKMKSSITMWSFMPVIITLTSISVGLIVNIGGQQILDGTLTIGKLTLFTTYAILTIEPLIAIADVSSLIQSAQASAERIFAFIDEEQETLDKEEVIKKFGNYLNYKEENLEKILGDIKFKNICFYYNKDEEIINNFNLHIKKGEKVAIVGETGCGKSTIANLLCRFYEPTSGTITIDDIDYKERPLIWLQSNLGYVLQTPQLFSGSVMDNIRYGKLDATEEEVINAAKLANAYDFIMQEEEGFNYEVGENGNNLSVGEKQLISIARVIIGNKKIIVLDEATASIDTEKEERIQKATDIVLEGKTALIIAHRLSTIKSCDKILVMKDGKIVEFGSHDELVNLKGKYYNFYIEEF